MPENTTTKIVQPEYKWAHPLEWLRYKVNEHRDDPAWLADCITSLTTGMDGDTIQDLFQSEMVADGYFASEGETEDDYDEPPDVDDSVRFCPECETPNQFGELCSRCRRDIESEGVDRPDSD